ncbi:Cyclic nucleotide-binding domain-containing protein [Heracleum sosnowskyi]|uniref:Cyclic nucleotide-binding domain-containing protein n=1 Tax=Heracleum sosnowskyi TaxID=360622 RepID=A0AAD8H6Z7_9APIA|nr:Cyclic nucleotide-binding domain-containing protein [Heracleum sosnowskyi]
MATLEQEVSYLYGDTTINDDNDDEEESSEGASNITTRATCSRGKIWFLGKVLDPRASWIQEWNRVFLLVCATGLFVDPLFFYALSISEACMCLFVDGYFAITITVLRCMTDSLHVWNMWLQLKINKRPHAVINADERSRACWFNLKLAKKGFLFDLLVILPIPQVVLWIVIPALLKKGSTTEVMTILLVMFLLQYLPKIYHSVYLLRRMQNLSGIQRATKCLTEQCMKTQTCGPKILACQNNIFYGGRRLVTDNTRLLWGENKQARSLCVIADHDKFGYKWTVQLVTNESRLEKLLFPLFWGLMTLSTFGNLESTTDWLEVVFIIIVLTSGLLLVTMLIGNIKVFLHATTSKKQAMQLKMRNVEWWMRKRHLPHEFRQRVRNYERHRWAAMRGVDECDMTRNLPEGLRRDIKYHLCLDLVRQVPLFQHMDSLVLENICDRVKSLIFTKGETISREGDPVQRMLFIWRRAFIMVSYRRPFVERLPLSSSSLETLETTEAFGLDAEDVKYVTQHFRYTFVNEKVKRSGRYYSPGWRTWAAVAIQLAWRRYRHRLTLSSLSFIRPRRPLSRCCSLGEDRLRLYAALLTSPNPNHDDFDF